MHSHYDAIVVGAGFAGVRSVQRLRNCGFSVKGIERSSSLGGAWRTNCYPGARCDSPAPFYQIMDETLARDWNWSQRFPMQPEVLEYFEYVDSKLDISKDYDFGTTVTQAVFDETNAAWNVSLSDGRLLLARWLVLGVGFSSKTRVPNIEGLQLFEGEIHHTGAWPESGGDVKGKKVAIVGTGTSAAQTIREIGPSVASLTVYQRDPAIALPLLPNDSVDPDPSLPQRGEGNGLFAAKALSTFTGINHAFLNPNAVPADSPTRQAYYNYLYEKGDWSLLYSNFEDMWTNESVSNDVYSVWAKRTRERIEDAAKCDLLVPETPNHPIGTKRVCLIDNYYETFNRPNVSLVDIVKEPLREITKTGIRSGEEHHDYDMIIFATGFQPLASGILAMNITGRSGMRLEDSWNKSSNSYLGMTVPGFPNMLYLNGPGSPTVGVNAPTVIEHQTQWMMTLLNFLRKSYISTFEATDAAAQGWRKELIKQWDASLFSSAIIMQNNNHASRGKEPTWITGAYDYGARINLCQPPDLPGFATPKGRSFLCKSWNCHGLVDTACVGCQTSLSCSSDALAT